MQSPFHTSHNQGGERIIPPNVGICRPLSASKAGRLQSPGLAGPAFNPQETGVHCGAGGTIRK